MTKNLDPKRLKKFTIKIAKTEKSSDQKSQIKIIIRELRRTKSAYLNMQ
jgi:hypothetical protein